MNEYRVTTDGIDTLMYEDISCIVTCNVADFRDSVWWVTILTVFDKGKQLNVLLNGDKQLEVYKSGSESISWTLKS
jgi:hypothetical protein